MTAAAKKPRQPDPTFPDFTTDELRVRLADAEKARHYREGVHYAMEHVRVLRAEIRRREAAAEAAPTPAMVPQVCQQQADAGAAAKPAHTPGPWHRNIRPASKYPTVWAGRNTHVAAISPGAPRGSGNGCTMSEEEQEANINLIVAAPDLLAALRDARDSGLIYWEPSTERGHVAKAKMLARIDAVLAKAEGRTA